MNATAIQPQVGHSEQPKLPAAPRLQYRRSISPIVHPQFKQRMVLPLLIEKPTTPGINPTATANPQATS